MFRSVLGGALIALGPFSTDASAQSPQLSAALSTDSVALAEVFHMQVRTHVPPGSAVYFPDTIQSTPDVESFEDVTWESERAPDGGADLTLTYALIPFGSGPIGIPGVPLVTAPAPPDAEGASLPGNSFVGSWDDAPRGIARGLVTTRSADQSVWVHRLLTAEEVAAGVAPRGPDDVMGLGWSPWTILFLAVFTAILLGALRAWATAWLAGLVGPVSALEARRLTLEEARLAALAELDRIAAGPYATEAERSLYSSTSGAVRGYVERLDDAWGPGFTSTELMEELRPGAGDGLGLAEEMRVAERVKFGRLRTGSTAFAEHVRTLKGWLTNPGGRGA